MTGDIAIFLVIFMAALVLFAFEWVSSDVTALGILVALILTGLLPSETAFAGFGSDTAMMILGLLILTAGLTRTGVVELAGRIMVRYTGDNPLRVKMAVIVIPSVLGAFMSNTASAAFFLPLTMGLARKVNISASKLLMPMAFASILSSSVTLISTSTNIVVSGLMRQEGMRPLGVFELTPVGIPIMVVGLVYMMTIGERLVPDRLHGSRDVSEMIRPIYVTEAIILPNSPLIGKSLAESGLREKMDVHIRQIVRKKTRYLAPIGNTVLQEGDVLLVQGDREAILNIKERVGIDIKADAKLVDTDVNPDEQAIVEAIILPRSRLINRTLKSYRFRERHGLQVLAINRAGETIRSKISQETLHPGDILLVQGSRDNIAMLQEGHSIRLLNVVRRTVPNFRRAPLALGIFTAVLLLASVGTLSIAVAVLLGAVAVFLTRCITPEEAYREIEWKALILIGSMLAFGAAMSESGTADYLAEHIVNAMSDSSPILLLSVFFFLTVILTQPMSNQAAAVVVLPVAIQTALQLDLNPRTFAIMIAVAASTSYLTPLEPACMLVYGAGNYRFFDFVKVGALLTVIIYLIAILMIPVLWPL